MLAKRQHINRHTVVHDNPLPRDGVKMYTAAFWRYETA